MTTYTASLASATRPIPQGGPAGGLKVARGSFTPTTKLAAGDVIELIRVPRGAVVVGGVFQSEILDTATTPILDMDIGWAANGTEALDADGFGNLGPQKYAAVTGVKPEATFSRYEFGNVIGTAGWQAFSAETVLQATVIADAATAKTPAASLARTISMVAYYYVP